MNTVQACEDTLALPERICEAMIDAREVGKLLRLHPKTVKRMAAAGEIPALRIGRIWRFRASALDGWVAAQLQSNRHPRPPQQEAIR
jgi:excisionase family DNA binding protein